MCGNKGKKGEILDDQVQLGNSLLPFLKLHIREWETKVYIGGKILNGRGVVERG